MKSLYTCLLYTVAVEIPYRSLILFLVKQGELTAILNALCHCPSRSALMWEEQSSLNYSRLVCRDGVLGVDSSHLHSSSPPLFSPSSSAPVMISSSLFSLLVLFLLTILSLVTPYHIFTPLSNFASYYYNSTNSTSPSLEYIPPLVRVFTLSPLHFPIIPSLISKQKSAFHKRNSEPSFPPSFLLSSLFDPPSQ